MTDHFIRISVACLIISITVFDQHAKASEAWGEPELSAIKTCVLQTSPPHDPNTCIGLVSEACATRMSDQNTCLDHEAKLWLKLLKTTGFNPNDFYPEIVREAFDSVDQCRQTRTNALSCFRDIMARFAIPRLLALNVEITQPPDFNQLKRCTAFRKKTERQCKALARSICADSIEIYAPSAEEQRQCLLEQQRLAVTSMIENLLERSKHSTAAQQYLRSFSMLMGITINALCDTSVLAKDPADRSSHYQACVLVALALIAQNQSRILAGISQSQSDP